MVWIFWRFFLQILMFYCQFYCQFLPIISTFSIHLWLLTHVSELIKLNKTQRSGCLKPLIYLSLKQKKNNHFWLLLSSGNWTRTNDLRVMSPTSYLLLYPAISSANIQQFLTLARFIWILFKKRKMFLVQTQNLHLMVIHRIP